MKILFLRDFLIQSGSSSAVFDLLRGIRKRNHKVQVITWGGFRAGEFINSNIPVKRVKRVRFPSMFSRRFSKMVELGKIFQPDIVQVESVDMFRTGLKLSAVLGAQAVFMVHQFLPAGCFPSRKAMRSVRIITVSQALREYLVNKVKLEKENISVLRNGIDISNCPPRLSSEETSTFVIGMCDSYAPERGHECFLKACRILMDRERDIHIFVCGYGKGEKRVKDIARSLDIAGSVTFVYDFRDIRKIMSLYDIFVMPSRKEGFGYRALEAMAMGIPVIASSAGGLMDVVHDEETGLLFKPEDPEQMASKIEYLMGHPDIMKQMGVKGRKLIESQFSADQMVENIIEIYNSFSGTQKRNNNV